MPKLHRLHWIDAQVRAGRYPNARTLAAAFGISHRQALRDFEYMRDSLGAPLVYSAAHRGFTYGESPFVLPGPYVTETQQAALGHLARYYEAVAEHDRDAGPVYADLAGLFRRLSGLGSAPARAARGAEQPLPLVPYRAILAGPSRPAPLQPFYRGRAPDGKLIVEFHDPDAFLCALWDAPGCRIESPRWLRERLRVRAERIVADNRDMTRHVTPAAVNLSQEPGMAPGSKSERRMAMEKRRGAVGARFVEGWMSYVGAVQGVLDAAGMGPWEYWRLMGETGMAFHLVMHETCCISSVTVYDWMNTHSAAMSRIGVLSEVYQALPGTPTYDAACRRAVVNIRESIDNGVGVVLWGVDTGEFGVVHGYDDEDGVLLTSGCWGSRGRPILYENIGRTFPGAPVLHYQIMLERVPTDERQTARSALQHYVDLMDRPGHIAPGYRAGLLAYDNWIQGLQTEGFSGTGCRYATFVYTEARECAARYVAHLAGADPALKPAADAFRRTAEIYGRMMKVLGQDLSDPSPLEAPVSAEQAAALVPLLREAKQSEAETVALVQRYLETSA
ncbi:hypothetical protein J2Z79_001680 [Symbiobacterium terraclitae]|uniref:Helix-turn-helix type 11 domain-containing protein n=1 Tax=Symbiobacterium terraclitae TaxID=557451 RepID=A0ABS4JRX7_9FIRM|nr:hypothetical protein [Symbiobacterium terraclitae]MBP2018279.1 hypothetical protein [Symbiobacterium terraclitae]